VLSRPVQTAHGPRQPSPHLMRSVMHTRGSRELRGKDRVTESVRLRRSGDERSSMARVRSLHHAFDGGASMLAASAESDRLDDTRAQVQAKVAVNTAVITSIWSAGGP